MAAQLFNFRVAAIATDGFEEAELTDPVRALREAGASVDIISMKPGQIQAFKHHDKSIQVKVDRTIDEVQPEEYQALLLPGGALNADAARVEPKIQAFVKAMDDVRRPIAFICHAPWILISSGLVHGRALTSYHTIRDDLRNAGAHWLDQEVVLDGNWVSSRQPDDLPAFNREMIHLFAQSATRAREAA